MLEKNEDNTDDNNDDNFDRTKLIVDKKTLLKEHFLVIQKEIQISFAQLKQTLNAREKQLLRQAEALYRQQVSLALSNPEILPPSITIIDDGNDLEEQIKQFLRIELTGSNSIAITDLEPYKIQEYQDVNKDHVSFDKSIKSSESPSCNSKMELSLSIDKKLENNGLKTHSTSNLPEKTRQMSDFKQESLTQSPKIDSKCKKNDLNSQSDSNVQEKANSIKNLIEDQHNGMPEQIQQWLDQIVLETEIEPTIHEVEKLLG